MKEMFLFKSETPKKVAVRSQQRLHPLCPLCSSETLRNGKLLAIALGWLCKFIIGVRTL